MTPHPHGTGPPKEGPPVEKTVVGWREYVALPDWDVPPLKTKVDTGARTSAIDVVDVVELGNDRVRFEVAVSRDDVPERIAIETDVVRRTRVKSSFGESHDRLIVATRIRLGEIEKTIEMSLVSRKKMLCRMLLGRKALEPNLVVDPARRYLHGRKPRKKRVPTEGKTP